MPLNRRKHTYLVPSGPAPTQVTQNLVNRSRGPQDEMGRTYGEAQKRDGNFSDSLIASLGGPRKPLPLAKGATKSMARFMAGRAQMRNAGRSRNKKKKPGDNSPVSTGGGDLRLISSRTQ